MTASLHRFNDIKMNQLASEDDDEMCQNAQLYQVSHTYLSVDK